MKQLLLLLPLLCFSPQPAMATAWAVWLAGIYCDARNAGFDNDRAVEMMFYEGNNSHMDHIQKGFKNAMTNDRDLALDMILLHVDKRRGLDICGVD